MTGISLLTMLLKKNILKSIHMTMTVPIVNDTCNASVIRELGHDRDTYHYPVNIDFF